ncbi:MAG: HD domain-containing protein [Thermodesulfobacteriota bacterium]
MTTTDALARLRDQLDAREASFLAPEATLSSQGRRRRHEGTADHRQAFAIDTDRILHSLAYTRYIDKTQVFSLMENDHITHRVLHVQLVSKIGRTIGRHLGLNEDLIEAIALGHDIGHPPFGHQGEQYLAALTRSHGLPPFQHNLASIQFLERIERRGRGMNLCLQTLDGILTHDGEIHDDTLSPMPDKDFAVFDQELAAKAVDPGLSLSPMTLEGCVVRLTDTVSYIGRDIEDAITLALIRRDDLPAPCTRVLGDTNGKIVYRLVTDVVAGGIRQGGIGFSAEVAEALRSLKAFNYQRIYLNPLIKKDFHLIEAAFQVLFARSLEDLLAERRRAAIFRDHLDDLDPLYRDSHTAAAIVRDFIAGMTDAYFRKQAAALGCPLPAVRSGRLLPA